MVRNTALLVSHDNSGNANFSKILTCIPFVGRNSPLPHFAEVMVNPSRLTTSKLERQTVITSAFCASLHAYVHPRAPVPTEENESLWSDGQFELVMKLTNKYFGLSGIFIRSRHLGKQKKVTERRYLYCVKLVGCAKSQQNDMRITNTAVRQL